MKKAIMVSAVTAWVFLHGQGVDYARADYASTILADNPVAYYRFEEPAGATSIVDSSGNGHDSLEVNLADLGVPGVHGNAVEFLGDGNIVVDLQMDPADSEGDGIGVGRDDFSIELFVNLTADDTGAQIFVAQQDGGGLGRSDMIFTGNGFLGSFLGGGTSDSDVDPDLDTWYHFVMTYDGEGILEPINFYVDGEWAGAGTLLAESADGDWVIGSHKGQAIQFTWGLIDEVSFYDYRLDDPNGDDDMSDSRILAHFEGTGGAPQLQAGDSDQDLDFDQLDLVLVQIAAKYLTGQPATWGEGDWNGAPGGSQGSPPPGDGQFNQLDIIAALGSGLYLQGPYAAVAGGGQANDAQTSIGYNADTGEVWVDAPTGNELTSINVDSAAGIFTGEPAQNLGGSFDNDADNNIFKATFGSSFGTISFGTVAQVGLSEQFVLDDLSAVGSLAGGGDLGNVDLIYVPEPNALLLSVLGAMFVLVVRRQRR